MTFSYGYDFANDDKDRVRFEIGDTGEKDADGTVLGSFLEDEEINGLLALSGATWQTTTLKAIRGIIAKLSRPAFTADWLKVDPKVAIDSFRKLLAEKEAEYGLTLGEDWGGWFESGSVDVTRSDVDEDWIPRYTEE